MNQHVSISYEQVLKDAYKARKARFGLAVSRYQDSKRVAPAKIIFINPIARRNRLEPKYAQLVMDRAPLWKSGRLYFNAHVIAYQRGLEQERPSVRRYIAERARELGFSIEAVTGPSRTRELTRARQQIMWEIKRVFKPDVSYPELGRIFNRDHTTVLYAVERIDEIMKHKRQ